jgi:hypothetical protein
MGGASWWATKAIELILALDGPGAHVSCYITTSCFRPPIPRRAAHMGDRAAPFTRQLETCALPYRRARTRMSADTSGQHYDQLLLLAIIDRNGRLFHTGIVLRECQHFAIGRNLPICRIHYFPAEFVGHTNQIGADLLG